MTLRKCIFILMIIENGVFEIFGATTEIIYKPLSMLRGLLHFNQNERSEYYLSADRQVYHLKNRPCIESVQI